MLVISSSRIIPARAGFTRLTIRTGASGPDHPRSRGVYLFGVAQPETSVGSSPLARGLLPDQVDQVDQVRIIPARAGFTQVLPA